ncbi:hypothetical protein ACHAXR_002470, partial [Thalassiosira sp. AJA248-18]
MTEEVEASLEYNEPTNDNVKTDSHDDDVMPATNVDQTMTHHRHDDHLDELEQREGSDNDSNDRPHSAITEKLNLELALSNTHRLQLQSHWRQILSKEKFQELHNGIPHLTQYHDENILRKKEVVTSLVKQIQHLQELYQDAMVANMNRMDDLIAIHDDQVVKLERNLRNRVSSLQSQFRIDVEQINTQYNKEKEATREAIQRQTQKDQVQIKAMRQEHQHELEEIKNRNLEHINSLRFIMDSRVEDLEEQFELTHSEFAQNTDGTRTAYDQLKSKDDIMRTEIETKTRHANKLQREIQRFQLIARQEEARIHERHVELLARKSRAIARWNMTQEEMSKFRNEQQRKLVDLIKHANERKDVLRKQCALAERVTKIALACRKYESSREEFATLLRESSCPAMMEKVPSRHDDGGGENKGDDGKSSSLQNNEEQRSFIIG